jgi:hypothetical protein
VFPSLLSTSLLYGVLISVLVLAWTLLLAFGGFEDKAVPAKELTDGVAGSLADGDGAQRATEPAAS